MHKCILELFVLNIGGGMELEPRLDEENPACQNVLHLETSGVNFCSFQEYYLLCSSKVQEVFLKASCSSMSAFGCDGRGTTLRQP